MQINNSESQRIAGNNDLMDPNLKPNISTVKVNMDEQVDLLAKIEFLKLKLNSQDKKLEGHFDLISQLIEVVDRSVTNIAMLKGEVDKLKN